jgi:formate hydrogenlyase subunit 3/multisubunit Na+/H+ antiporter MnhD subunit
LTIAALAPPIILTFSAVASTITGRRSIARRNIVIAFSFVSAVLVNTHFLILSLNGGFGYAKIGEFTVNAASIFISELVLVLAFLGALYSFSYIEERSETWAYYLLYQLFTAMMIAMVSSFNVLVMYVFLEASSVTSAILVMFSRRRSSILAAYRYLVLSIFGGIIIIGGIFWQYQLTHTLNLAGLASLAKADVNSLATIYLLGFGVKAGLLPFGLFWLPPAHSEAPIPIHTLLSAALVQVAAFDIARVLGGVGIGNMYITTMLLATGLASMIAGALYALIEAWYGSEYTRLHVGLRHIRGIKRVWAFSTISEVGYITLFLGLAGLLANQKAGYEEALVLGFGGALLHMYNHGFSKAQLLFDSGVMIKVSHAEDLNLMGPLAKRLPIMKVSFVIGALSLGLIPTTFGVRTLRELVFNNNIPSLAKLVVIATAGLSLIACLSVWYCCFFFRSNIQSDDRPKVPRTMYLPGLLMGGLIILVGSYFTLEWAGLISSGSSLADALRILAETTIKSSAGA